VKSNTYTNYSLKLYLILIFSLIGILLFIGTSWSLVRKTLVLETNVSVETGNLLVSFVNADTFTLSNKVPTYDDIGIKSEDEFNFSITNNGDYAASYSVKIEDCSDGRLSEVIRYAVDYGNGYEHKNIHSLINNPYIIQNKSLAVSAIDNYSVRFWVDIDASEVYASEKFKAKLVISATQEEYKYATDVLEKIYTGEEKDGLVLDSNSEYRYVGNEVNNYVWFNCDNGYAKGIKHCEKWRIIGSFKNNLENGFDEYMTLKIIRDEALGDNYVYNSGTSALASYNDSSIKKYLNDVYYKSFDESAI